MAISEFEEKRCEREMEKFLVEHRPPIHMRDEFDIAYRIKGQSVEIFEIRPRWDNNAEKIETPVAKTTYVKKHKIWKIYWYRSDMKWHGYEPYPEAKLFEEFLCVVGEDRYSCFWG